MSFAIPLGDRVRLKVGLLGVMMLIILVFVTPMQATTQQTLTLKDVQQAIAEKHANWTADETSVWLLPLALKQRLAGAKMVRASTSSGTVQLDPSPPGQFDWRNAKGVDYTTAIKQQGLCGSCYIFGSVAVVESLFKMHQGSELSQPDFSEQYVLSNCQGCGNCVSGGYSDRVFAFIQRNGLTFESCFPYIAESPPWSSSSSSVADGSGCPIVSKIDGWGFVPLNREQIKAYLLAYGPLTATMAIYEDFWAYSGGVYQHVVGDYKGGHLVTIVGYDDAGGYWIAKNSWGTGWGEGGWFRIAYGNSGIDSVAVIYASMVGSAPGSISGFSITVTTATSLGATTNSTRRNRN